jgi:hypothetical protein
MESEADSYQHIGGVDVCNECDKLKRKLIEAEREVEVYKQNVKNRRKCDEVWIESGTVVYR